MKSSRKPSFRGWRKLPFCVLAIAVLSVCIPASIPVARAATAQCQVDHTAGFLHSFHSELADASGCKVRLKGVNWFGFETRTFSPHGLWARNWQDMLGQITQAGFNTIRLPFSNQLFDPSSKPQGIDYKLKDRKSTRLNSSHTVISYAVFCLKTKKLRDEGCADWEKGNRLLLGSESVEL